MILWLVEFLQNYIQTIIVFNYLTLRVVFATLTSLILVLLIGPTVIKWLTKYQVLQVVRKYTPSSHFSKSNTPTMGGVLIVVVIVFVTLLWAKLDNTYIWITLFVIVGFSCIGFIDDYRKLVLKDPVGLSGYYKYILQSIIGIVASVTLYNYATSPEETALLVPFFKNVAIPLGWFYIILSYFVIVGSSNAVNLTDGLDGLAILPAIIIAGALGIFSYVLGHVRFAEYLTFPYIPRVEELAVLCGAIVGAGLAFLWFNSYPAEIFMGDVGSLGLGAALGVIAIIVRQEIVLFIMGGVFVVETLSVILQVLSFKLIGKRIFKMSPLHHHFELSGWPEPKIIVRFWLITVILVLIGLTTLKLR